MKLRAPMVNRGTHMGVASLRRVWLRGHYGESWVLDYRGKSYALSAGMSDSVAIYEDQSLPRGQREVYVLSSNSALGYIGLQVFREDEEAEDPNAIGLRGEITRDNETFYRAEWEIFTEQPEEMKPEGTPLLDMSAPNAIRFMSEWRM